MSPHYDQGSLTLAPLSAACCSKARHSGWQSLWSVEKRFQLCTAPQATLQCSVHQAGAHRPCQCWPRHCCRSRIASTNAWSHTRSAAAAPAPPLLPLLNHSNQCTWPHRTDSSALHIHQARTSFARCIMGGEPSMRLAEAALHISAEDDAVGACMPAAWNCNLCLYGGVCRGVCTHTRTPFPSIFR